MKFVFSILIVIFFMILNVAFAISLAVYNQRTGSIQGSDNKVIPSNGAFIKHAVDPNVKYTFFVPNAGEKTQCMFVLHSSSKMTDPELPEVQCFNRGSDAGQVDLEPQNPYARNFTMTFCNENEPCHRN
jgi:hypothetical protein